MITMYDNKVLLHVLIYIHNIFIPHVTCEGADLKKYITKQLNPAKISLK